MFRFQSLEVPISPVRLSEPTPSEILFADESTFYPASNSRCQAPLQSYPSSVHSKSHRRRLFLKAWRLNRISAMGAALDIWAVNLPQHSGQECLYPTELIGYFCKRKQTSVSISLQVSFERLTIWRKKSKSLANLYRVSFSGLSDAWEFFMWTILFSKMKSV